MVNSLHVRHINHLFCSIMQFICNWIPWYVSQWLMCRWRDFILLLFSFEEQEFFCTMWSTKIIFSFTKPEKEKKNCWWCCVIFTVYVLHFQQDDDSNGELLFTCSCGEFETEVGEFNWGKLIWWSQINFTINLSVSFLRYSNYGK